MFYLSIKNINRLTHMLQVYSKLKKELLCTIKDKLIIL